MPTYLSFQVGEWLESGVLCTNRLILRQPQAKTFGHSESVHGALRCGEVPLPHVRGSIAVVPDIVHVAEHVYSISQQNAAR